MKKLLINDSNDEAYRDTVDRFIAEVEPLAGFRPESPIQAISLLISAFRDMEPAIEALQDLVAHLDLIESEDHDKP